jgi:TM2 domain-containing membrane protein YozV
MRQIQGNVYCEECLAAMLHPAAPRYTTPAPPPMGVPAGMPMPGDRSAVPVLGAILGFIPGVGAMYNGQVLKGFLHVGIFASLIWITDSVPGAELVGLFIAAWVFYMAWDGWATARARHYGWPLPDPLGINRLTLGGDASCHARAPMAASPQGAATPGAAPLTPVAGVEPAEPAPSVRDTPIWAIVLIVLGALFLMESMGVLRFSLAQFWPLILIFIGIWILVQRFMYGKR